MTCFSTDSTAFLQDLAKNNDREWFAANKARYEQYLKKPAAAFAQEMAGKLEALTGTPHKPKVFRIYRDVRFSKDKTPYNTHLRISFAPEGEAKTPPGWFFGIEQDHVVVGTGVFGYEKAELERFRDRIAGSDGAALEKILGKLKATGVRIGEPDLKRVPAGYDADHPRSDLLRHKGLTVWVDQSDAKSAYGEKAVANCLAEFRKLKPVFDWLNV